MPLKFLTSTSFSLPLHMEPPSLTQQLFCQAHTAFHSFNEAPRRERRFVVSLCLLKKRTLSLTQVRLQGNMILRWSFGNLEMALFVQPPLSLVVCRRTAFTIKYSSSVAIKNHVVCRMGWTWVHEKAYPSDSMMLYCSIGLCLRPSTWI